jgi:hypothetical protein
MSLSFSKKRPNRKGNASADRRGAEPKIALLAACDARFLRRRGRNL